MPEGKVEVAPRPGCAMSCVARGQAARSADRTRASGAATRWPRGPRPGSALRITLKKAYADGTVAVDMDPLWPRARLRAARGSESMALAHNSASAPGERR